MSKFSSLKRQLNSIESRKADSLLLVEELRLLLAHSLLDKLNVEKEIECMFDGGCSQKLKRDTSITMEEWADKINKTDISKELKSQLINEYKTRSFSPQSISWFYETPKEGLTLKPIEETSKEIEAYLNLIGGV
ncbi:hypothetical protein ACFFIF_08025 [Vagococcus entomophilus]|uniref:Uncharacterized protein n=1 Tax=Vagococcus entomophilus TaxID=1160095 RepID=A0A430AHA3_9ENTE|nr:hypothetical protein [Vagococcus entomophilus]RSU07290.1 hypothetical protein CBF30_08540 [Vagococcus entomophilus]